MKVRDLIELLQKQDPEAGVFTEGCDCIGIVDNVITLEQFFSVFSRSGRAPAEEDKKDVMITREE